MGHIERRSCADVKAHLSEVVDHAEHPGKRIMRMVTRLEAADRLLFQMYRLAEDGAETLVSEIAHVRRSI